MLTPYPGEVTVAMTARLKEAGITVVSSGSFHIENDHEIINIMPDRNVAAATAVNSSDSQAPFIPGTGLRTSTIIDTPLKRRR